MTADSWFRFYNTAMEHPKVMMLSDANFRLWLRLLSFASKMKGVLPHDPALVARALGKTPQKAADALQIMLSAGLFDRTELGYVPHNWGKRQFKSDSSSGRVKRFRENGGNVSETDHRQRHRQKEKESKNARDARFEEFWQACPKKTGKGAAERAWTKAIQLASPENLTAAMGRYAQTQAGKDPAYIKTPGPWLNEKRWLDEVSLAPKLVFENTDERGWRDRLRAFRDKDLWSPRWGPKPGEEGCKCPSSILVERAA